MGWWWPFSSSGTAGGAASVENIPNLSQTQFFENVQSGEETHYGGKSSGVSVSEIDRARDMHNILNKGDYRASIMDPESIDCLMSRYGAEITAADAKMREKVEQQRYFERYDYAGDRRFQQWKEDRERVQEKLQVHWIDMLIDRPTTILVYYLRIGVVAGFFYGVGRTTYLYRTMDKMYAKLNGVTVGKIAFHELTYGIAKGGMVAAAGTLGVIVGNVVGSLVSVAASRDVHVPERQWWHVANCGGFSGAFAGAAFGALHLETLTRRAIAASVVGLAAAGGAVGTYYGYCVYRPYAAAREKRLYETYWRPWQERRLKMEGPGNIRGRYV